MIHIPSERVLRELISNQSTFSIDLGDDQIPTIVYKNNSLLLKQFSLGKLLNIKVYNIKYLQQNYLFLTHTLENDINTYFSFIYSIEEYNAILSLIKSTKNYCFLFDETNSSQAGSNNININYGTYHLQRLMDTKFTLYNYEYTVPNYNKIFDNLEKLYLNQKSTLLIDMTISSSDWQPSTSTFLTNTGQATKVSILNKDEGQIFNDQVATLLIKLFDNTIFLNPQAQIDVNKREMTDIICIEENCILLFETKVQSVFCERNPNKINNSILKNVHKAIEQLKGANNWYDKKCRIYDNNEKEIKLKYGLFTFNIVMVSEYPIFENNDDFFKAIENLYKDKGIIIIILDTKMLELLIKNLKGDKNIFYANLIGIFKTYIKAKSLNIEIKSTNAK